MEGLTLAFFLALLVDSICVVGAENFPGNRDAFFHGIRRFPPPSGGHRHPVRHSNRFPLYMMQLYRTLLEGDTARTPTVSAARTNNDDNPRLHDSDYVLSLVAKSEYFYFTKQNSLYRGFFFCLQLIILCFGDV